MKKLNTILVAMLFLIFIINNFAFASDAYSISITPSSPEQMMTPVQTLLGIAQWIGFIVGVAMIIWVGVKYLTSGAGKKAEVKSTMIPILVGAFLIALAPTIANWLFTMFGSN